MSSPPQLKTKQLLALITLALFILITCGCTNKAWYEGVKEGAKNNCRSQPPGEVDACLEKLNNKTYEEYEKERSGQK
jgi:hypothetical protein